MKTLVVILNYNVPALTDQLYRSLKPFESDIYDLHVLDNCSPTGGKSQYTTLESEQNCYFGGALNLAIEYVLSNKDMYDSLMFLNNDVLLHGYNYVKSLRYIMFQKNYMILSPCGLQPEENQIYWRQMHNYSSIDVRDVKWCDFYAPLFNIKFLEEVKQFSNDLIMGWGQDIFSGLLCEEKNWKIGVVDWCPVIHMSSYTFREGKGGVSNSEYSMKAERDMWNYFQSIGKVDKLQEFRDWGRNYKL